MRNASMTVGLASVVLLLTSVPVTQGLPGWHQPQHRNAPGAVAPRQYDVYGANPPAYGHYSYGGYGPQPTVSTAEISSVSSDSGVATSSSDAYGKSQCINTFPPR